MKKMNIMTKLYNSKVFWLIISLLASMSLWIYVTGQETEEYKQTFRGVRVELIGEDILLNSRNMVITDLSTSTVTVEVSGPRRVVGRWSSGDLVAQIDVSKLTQSAFTSLQYTVKFPDGTDTSGVKTNSRSPETINFMVSPQTKKVVPVVGSFEGRVAEGFTAEPPEFDPSTITVYGPETYLKNISRAWVEFGSQEISSTYSVDAGFRLLDENDEECSTTGLNFSNDTVKATLRVLEVKEIPLTVDLIGGAGASSANTMVSIEPDSITLAGDTAVLSDLNRISLATIDLSDFASTFSDTYLVKFDDGLKNLSGTTEANVTIEIVGLETRDFSVSRENMSCINVTDGYNAQVLSDSLVVKLRGTEEQLQEVRSENIRAVADLKDYNTSTGQFMPAVRISVDGFTDVGAIGDYTISIELRKGEA
jgi:YbbR domain-containing protein